MRRMIGDHGEMREGVREVGVGGGGQNGKFDYAAHFRKILHFESFNCS